MLDIVRSLTPVLVHRVHPEEARGALTGPGTASQRGNCRPEGAEPGEDGKEEG